MDFKFFIVILGSMFINYIFRAFPILSHNGRQPGIFLKSFLEYIPYGALGALLFPDVFYSTANTFTSVSGLIFASTLILLKQNMIIVVSGTVLLVYMLNLYM